LITKMLLKLSSQPQMLGNLLPRLKLLSRFGVNSKLEENSEFDMLETHSAFDLINNDHSKFSRTTISRLKDKDVLFSDLKSLELLPPLKIRTTKFPSVDLNEDLELVRNDS